MIELEKTYLAKRLPEGIQTATSKKMVDIYFPKESKHANLRLRKKGDRIVFAKKTPIDNEDFGKLKEETIVLSEAEYNVFSNLDGLRVEKTRYMMKINNHDAEVDVFEGVLKGLVLIDFEFNNEEDKNNFQMPDICLADVTQEEFVAGGFLCGKSYEDLEENLNTLIIRESDTTVQ